MILSRSLTLAATLAALLAGAAASARDYNTQEVVYPPGHSANRHVSFATGEFSIGDQKATAYQVGTRLQSSHVFAAAQVEYADLSDEGDKADTVNVSLKAGYPIHAYPALQVTPYALFGHRAYNFEDLVLLDDLYVGDVHLGIQHAGVGALAQFQTGSLVIGVDIAKSYMLSAQIEMLGVSVPLDKRDVTSVRVEADWNFSGRHHLIASYTAQDWTLAATGELAELVYDEKAEEATLLIGYAFQL